MELLGAPSASVQLLESTTVSGGDFVVLEPTVPRVQLGLHLLCQGSKG